MEIAILLMSCFFAVNMGASSFAASFATACGSGAISKRKAQILYVLFIILGAVLFGKEVSLTLGKGIISPDLISSRAVLIILTAGTISLFTANLMHIPQSTSMSTIAAICGVGMFYQEVQMGKINYLAICWIVSTMINFLLILGATRYVYPPRKRNFWVYEKIVQHKERLQTFVVLTSCYNVFSQGTNNVPNVVGPLAGAGLVDIKIGLFVLGVIFSLGCFVFGGAMTTTSEKIVPLGILTATIINFISGTITLGASVLGIPQPAVIIYTLAVFAVGLIKNGSEDTLGNPVTAKTFFTWCVNPLLTLILSYTLSRIFLPHP